MRKLQERRRRVVRLIQRESERERRSAVLWQGDRREVRVRDREVTTMQVTRLHTTPTRLLPSLLCT